MTAEGSVEKLRTESQKKHNLGLSIEGFDIDGFEAGPEEIILRIASRFANTLQSYLYICYVLRVAAEMMYVDGLADRIKLLKLQELIRL
jgi:hypothetical protein